MSIIGFIRSYWQRLAAARIRRRLARQPSRLGLAPSQWSQSLRDPTNFYFECVRYFDQQLPQELLEHRAYFTRDRRGFGEDAFHVLWYLLFHECKPKNFLEIGVYRGQTISLAALLSRREGFACEVHGISPFSAAGDSVSRYRSNVDYLEDTLRNFDHFQLPRPALLRACSTDAAAVQLIRSRAWDMIYIDGNHDYEIARQDWEACSRQVKSGGVIVLDDAGLTTDFHPPVFATGGHPGPSRLVGEIDRSAFRELLQVGHNRAFQKMS